MNAFSNDQDPQVVFAAAIVNIGFKLDVATYEPHIKIAKKRGYIIKPDSMGINIFALTTDGQPI